MPLFLLILSIAALSIGPLMVRSSSAQGQWRRGLDGFVTIGVGGLVLFHILPPAIRVGGYPALLFVIFGAVLPTAIERVQYGHVRTAHAAALTLAFIALTVHATTDGLVMSQASIQEGWALSAAFAVILHRIPVGMAAWMFLRKSDALRWAWVVFGLIIVGTIVGFVSGSSLIRLMQDASFAWFQAFVAGSLLHVVMHAHEHDHHFDHGDPQGHGHDHVHHAHHPHDVAHSHHEHAHAHAHAHAGPNTHAHRADEHQHEHQHAHSHVTTTQSEPLQCVPEIWDLPHGTTTARVRSFLGLDAMIQQLPEVIGALLGVGLLFFLSWMEHHGFVGHEHQHHAHYLPDVVGAVDIQALGASFWVRLRHLALDGAVWLLAGYLLSVFLFRWIRLPKLVWLSSRGAVRSAFRGSVYGAGMPVRACGVVPVFASMVDRGVRWPAALSFLLTTPQLRVETLLFSVPLLGLPFTGIRALGIFLISIAVGIASGVVFESNDAPIDTSAPPHLSWLSAWHQALVRLVDDTAPWIVLGLMVAAMIPPEGFAWAMALPIGWSLLLFALLGVPLYICATGATPVALALMYVGFSPGAALVLLLSGPMTVWSAERSIRVRQGRARAWIILFFTWVLLLGLGAATHVLFDWMNLSVRPVHQHTAGDMLQWTGLVLIGVLFVWSLLRKGPRAWMSTVIAGDHG